MAPIKTLIGAAPCDNDSQCHTIAWGTKACGGPQAYLAWSTRNLDRTTLEAAVAAPQASARGRARGGISTCTVLADPGARCLATERTATAPDTATKLAGTGSCVLRSPGTLADR